MRKRGDVARIDYKWPADETAKREQGTKDRPCTVLETVEKDGKTIALRVIPHHGLPPGETPRPEDMPYAIRLKPSLQRAAGLQAMDASGRPVAGQKDSWILAHRANLVHVPDNPAVLRTWRNKAPSWTSGTLPEALLREIARRRALAQENGDLKEGFLEKSAPSGTGKTAARAAPKGARYDAGSSAARRDTAIHRRAAADTARKRAQAPKSRTRSETLVRQGE